MVEGNKTKPTPDGAVTLEESELDQAQGGLLPASARAIGTKKAGYESVPVELLPAKQVGP